MNSNACQLEKDLNKDNLIEIDLYESEDMNLKDFCGSQEFNLAFSNSNNNNKNGHSLSRLQASKSSPMISANLKAKTLKQHQQEMQQEPTETFFFTNETSSSSSLNSVNYNDFYNSNKQQAKLSASSQSSFCTYSIPLSTVNENCYNSSLISDYRLTLTDLIELNLIDITNGLIINPLNGMRLTVADAIKIDLLNSDVKEIANTFFNSQATKFNEVNCVKVTVREAIQMCILNANKNEIYLSPSNQNLKLNLYDARKRNLILKPLTLSEAFIRNLIQPNGFVRNPINNKYYAFETLIVNDLSLCNQKLSLKSACAMPEPMYLFDFDTKHIIDPNDAEKRLLSLSEAIDIGLILPRTFELNLSCRLPYSSASSQNQQQQQKLNLYDAFFNTNYLNLSLLLYKPEIENVYVKLAPNSVQSDKISIILSRREKVGLIEAIKLNVIDLKNSTYTALVNEGELFRKLDLAEAVRKHNLVDPELIELLNTPVGLKRSNQCELTVLDCINDSTLILEKYLCKNPHNNEYMQLDSHTCRALLGEETIKKIKRLITRINVKSYIISLNTNKKFSNNGLLASPTTKSASSIPASTQLINIKTPTVVYNKIQKSLNQEPLASPKPAVPPLPPKLKPQLRKDNLQPNKQPDLMSASAQSSVPKTNGNSGAVQASSLVKETKSYILDFVLAPVCDKNSVRTGNYLNQKLSVQEAKKRGILNVEKGLYIDLVNNASIPIDDAIQLGLIGARVAVCEKSFINDENESMPFPCNIKNSFSLDSKLAEIEAKHNHESSTLTIESVLDVKTGLSYSISDAIKIGILDQANLCFKNTLTGQVMSLNDAYSNGFVKGKFYENQSNSSTKTDPKNSNSSNKNEFKYSKLSYGNTVLAECEEKCYKITSLLNPITNTKMTLDQAINEGLFDKSCGLFIEPGTGQRVNLNEAYNRGYLQVELIDDKETSALKSVEQDKDSKVLVIDVNRNKSDTVLYQVNEVEEFTVFKVNDPKSIRSSSLTDSNLSEQRIEQIIVDEDEENYDEQPTELAQSPGKTEVKSRKRANRVGLRPNIVERRIPSFYGPDSSMTPETLIIDDVRRSAMLDIDGITHVFKNEFVIDCDSGLSPTTNNEDTKNDNLDSSSASSLSSPSKQLSSNNSVSSNSIDNYNQSSINANKSNNRTVIVVDEQLISVKETKVSNQTYDPLKIQVRKSTGAVNDRNSNEFLSNSERAQFERVLIDKEKEEMRNLVSFYFFFGG